ncbi:hypothetical protein A8E62_32080 [Burkholderia cenocepacia]|uniref:Uncharacterized protein n=1 Tax=Burkholderia cenocepacia TaxID=95486 RepID=A0A1V2VTS7_9BURK|nr:hypothetical protein A8E62_32080 [Burkholderia cenocepacia]ONU51190.1 hypothetical protein A8E67_35625 [Burkholderia cenocepacia]ONU66277.1 hypothetical protein A8E68_07325 [Burkholderia cenocepacia]ONU72309.1 hypothetical protein A8E63_39870 [Burkholderia cenocepacia]ONU76325.1 hypothetical protein A8E72_33990 [Burkholderia cenocepacia]
MEVETYIFLKVIFKEPSLFFGSQAALSWSFMPHGIPSSAMELLTHLIELETNCTTRNIHC